MKKNNTYITDDDLDLGELARILWREKILILSISVICGLLGYLYASFKPEEFKTEIKIKSPPSRLFEPYAHIFTNNSNNNNNNNNNNNYNYNNNYEGLFNSNFKLNFLSLDNLEIFVEESQDLDTLKKYLKSRNISTQQYFATKFGEVKKINIIIPNAYFLSFEKEILDGSVFLNKYVEFIKKKNINEFKANIKSIIENRINITENALEIAKLINLENPILTTPNSQNQVVNEPETLFYKGAKVLLQNTIIDKKLLQKLEGDQFDYNPILEKGVTLKINTIPSYFFLTGLFIGFFLSCIIIFFKSSLKE